MKKKILMLVMAFAIILPAAFLLSACGEKKSPEITETGISVYIDGAEVNEQFNTIDINYGDYTDITELINSKLSVDVNYSDQTFSNLTYGEGGFAISGLPQNLNANEEGYNLTLSYKNFSQDLILIIRKVDIDFSYVGWDYYEPYTYNGEEKTVELINVPEDVSVNYENNKKINAGTYNATATINFDETNYNIINNDTFIINNDTLVLTQQWTINKAQIDMWGVNWDYNSYDHLHIMEMKEK